MSSFDGLPDPTHRGVIDPSYVRGSDVKEFPKVAYRESAKDKNGFVTRVVKSRNEQDQLGKDWFTMPRDIHGLLESIKKAKELDEENKEAVTK